MEYQMKLLENPFNKIKSGTKTIEIRLYDEKRKKLKIGDTIEFYKLPELKEKLTTEILDLYQYNTFKELFEKIYKKDEEIEKKINSMYTIYTKEDEQKYGVLGIKIKLVN